MTSNAHHAGASTNATTLPPSLGTGATGCQVDHPGRPGKLVQSPGYTGRRSGSRRQRTPRLRLHRTHWWLHFPLLPRCCCPVQAHHRGRASRGWPVGDFGGKTGKRPTSPTRVPMEESFIWFWGSCSSMRRVVDTGHWTLDQTWRVSCYVSPARQDRRSDKEGGFGSVGWLATREARNCASELSKVSPPVVVVQHKRTAGLGVQFDVARVTVRCGPRTTCR